MRSTNELPRECPKELCLLCGFSVAPLSVCMLFEDDRSPPLLYRMGKILPLPCLNDFTGVYWLSIICQKLGPLCLCGSLGRQIRMKQINKGISKSSQ